MKEKYRFLMLGVLAGVVTASLTIKINVFAKAQGKERVRAETNGGFKYPLKVTLYRFRLNRDSMAVYEDWIKWQHNQHQAIVETLEREKMYVEAVFRDTVNQPDYIYWLAVNGEGGEHYTTSNLAVDKIHSEYMKKILVKGSRVVLKTEFTLLPAFIEKNIQQHQAAGK